VYSNFLAINIYKIKRRIMRNVMESTFYGQTPGILEFKASYKTANTEFARFNSERRTDLTCNNFSFGPYMFACFYSFLSFFDDFGIRNRR
jgi:hypothetical protein